MAKICHAHCPDDSGALLAALAAAVLTAVLAVIAARVIESLFAAIAITGAGLIAVGTGLFIWLIRRDRTSPPARARAITGRMVQVAAPRTAQALPGAQLRAIASPADARRSCATGNPARDQVPRGGVPITIPDGANVLD